MAGSTEIKEEYTSSLADLTFNSKPLISVLTILAEENLAHAKDIVEAIETHLSRVRVEVKLPVLYLIDCIIKNVGGPYTALFCQNIVSTFCSVFEQVDERTRAEMFRLRQTWNEVIPPKKLYALDVQITQLDPAWPVTAPPPNSIHFNPKFLKTTTTTASGNVTTTPVTSKPHTTSLISTASTAALDPKTLSMQQKLINKQRELLELQQRKLELELLQTQVKLQEQLKVQTGPATSVASTVSVSNVTHTQNLLLKPEVAKQLTVTTGSNKSTNSTLNAKSKTGSHTASSLMTAKLQNSHSGGAGPRIAPVQNSLANAARPIRDPRLLRHQQQQQQQQQQNSSSIVNSNVHLESKSKSGTQVTVDSDNKIVNNKTSVRNDRIELRLVNNKGNIESHGKSKTLPHSSPLKHAQKIGSSPRKLSKFSRDSKSVDLTDLKSSLSVVSLGSSPVKGGNRSDALAKNRSPSKSSLKFKKKTVSARLDKDAVSRSEKDVVAAMAATLCVDKDGGGSVRYDKSGALFRLDKDSGGMIRAAEKKNSKNMKSDKDSKLRKSENSGTSFKDLKGSTKNRNYIRRNRNASVSPEPNLDVDLRLGGPPEKQPRIQGDIIDDKSKPSDGSNDMPSQNMDVDLRQLPSVIGKKRPSTEATDSPNAKKSKSEMFDVLFGSEDTDLRQLPPVLSSPKGGDRPATPPPPIISEKMEKPKGDLPEIKEKKEPEKKELTPKNLKFEALRAKLANAVIQDKLKEPKNLDETSPDVKNKRSSHDTDMRKLPSFVSRADVRMDKIIISPADEECIKAGNMTKQQETALMNKIIAQIETQKLREAQRKESESLGNNISLQPISDDEFEADFSVSESDDDERPPEKKSSFGNEKDDRAKEDELLKEERAKEERIPPVPPQISQLEDAYPKFPRIVDHRDPRRGRPWRGRHRPKGWGENLPPGTLLPRPGIRPNLRSGPEPWIRPINDSWRAMGGHGPMYANNYSEPMIPNIPPPPHMMDHGSQSPKSSNHEIPALQYAHPDSYKFITIDGEPREIRYYDETAIVFMNAGDPREITFHNGTRRICFDGEPVVLKLNHPYEDVVLKGNVHRVRLGAPSREIFIDGKGYECYFDQNEKTIDLDGNKIVVKLEPPPPQVKIGQGKRLDLVAGKTQLVVDAKNMFTVFLDAKPQTFEIDGSVHTLKFTDALRAVLINDVRFEVEFGGLPKPVMLHDSKHFIRFSVLPKGIRPGHVNIKDMEGCLPSESPRNDTENSQDDSQPAVTQLHVAAAEQAAPPANRKRPFECDSPDRSSNSPHHFQSLIQQQNFNNLDMLSSVMASSMVPVSCEGGYKVESNAATSDSQHEIPSNSVTVPTAAPPEPKLNPLVNINELFQRLVATGIVTTAASSTSSVPPEEPPPPPVPFSPPKPVRNTSNYNKHLRPVDFGRSDTLKIRRQPLIQTLYLGMQCSSCGMRFPPEQSMYYSQHLDWHFRQNRKGKKNIRKASSRRWYYSLSDWKNYEELEDLEEREKSYFENQQQNQGEGGAEEGEEEIEIPCVPADRNVQDAACEVCQDKFEQFYSEEKDEWQLRMAVRMDDKTYHPLCYEDYQASLVYPSLDETKLNMAHDSENASGGIPLLESVDEPPSHKEAEAPENDEDDVMEVIDNIDDDETPTGEETKTEEAVVEKKEIDEDDDDDVIINEVVPEKIVVDDDDKDDYIPGEGLIPGVVVKEEPIDDGFVDVGNGLVKGKNDMVKIKTEPDDNDDPANAPAKSTADTADTTHIEVVSSIDGNVELDAGVPTSIGSKIKINITKPLPTLVPKESRDLVSDQLNTDCIDPSQPLPPGEEPVQLNVKPALKGLDLKRQPTVKKGTELTGLCSIM